MVTRAAEEVSEGMSALSHSLIEGEDGYDPWRGELLGERYRVLGRIGSGGASHVYVAEHVHLARRFAVKIMHDSRVGDPVALQRFMNEGKVAGRLGHPNIVEWTDMGFTAGGVPYLVMELLEGRNLEEELAATGPFSVERAARIGAQIASALAAAHGVGIIHRDLKTSNVIVMPNDGVKVLDFGISKLLGSNAPTITLRTRVVGTPQYMAPEQLLAPTLIGERTDVYALGVILYELVSGHTPFAGLTVSKCLELIVAGAPPSLHELRPDLPASFVRLVESALAKEPRDRPENMGAVRVALDTFAKGEPLRAELPREPRAPSPLPRSASSQSDPPEPRRARSLASTDTPVFVEPPLAAAPAPRPPSPAPVSAPPTASVLTLTGPAAQLAPFPDFAAHEPARSGGEAGPAVAAPIVAAVAPVVAAVVAPVVPVVGASAAPAVVAPAVAASGAVVAGAARPAREAPGLRLVILLVLLALASGALAVSHTLLVHEPQLPHRVGK